MRQLILQIQGMQNTSTYKNYLQVKARLKDLQRSTLDELAAQTSLRLLQTSERLAV